MQPDRTASVLDAAATVSPHVAAISVRGQGWGPRSQGSVSSVLFSDGGYLLTNAHVVADAVSGTAEFADGTQTSIDIVGSDPLSDLAVVRATDGVPKGFVELGNADDLRVGQLVVAIGNPLGL